jgi:hypothetical protein
MNLHGRIERLELSRKKGRDAATLMAIEAMKREIREMSDEELEAAIVDGEKEPCDPELAARMAEMTDDELCLLILESEQA